MSVLFSPMAALLQLSFVSSVCGRLTTPHRLTKLIEIRYDWKFCTTPIIILNLPSSNRGNKTRSMPRPQDTFAAPTIVDPPVAPTGQKYLRLDLSQQVRHMPLNCFSCPSGKTEEITTKTHQLVSTT